MILADKIINERKKNGWSQEDLAEKLSVSRQSISKWEGAQSIPDISKIIKMAEIFGVSTDYLLKDELEPSEPVQSPAPDTDYTDVRTVSMEEANEFLRLTEDIAPRRANMVSLCVFSPVILLFMIAMTQMEGMNLPLDIFVAVGVVSLLLLVAVAVVFFIIDAARMKPFEYLETAPIETMYGVSGMVREKKKNFEKKNIVYIAVGVTLCIISPIPLIIASIGNAEGKNAESVILFMVCVLLLFVCAGVNLFVRAGSLTDAFNMLLQEEDYTREAKKKSPIVNSISGIYWMCVTAVFLGWSFMTNDWGRTWIIWPIAGVLFAVVISVVKGIVSANRE
ncbi:MAG: helix-turn-helix transcriptional regulator [Lachnospiraceae bacterium]|nr:helix-turn-helix transcriptional regulator [Lachnospiraceae bacterium]